MQGRGAWSSMLDARLLAGVGGRSSALDVPSPLCCGVSGTRGMPFSCRRTQDTRTRRGSARSPGWLIAPAAGGASRLALGLPPRQAVKSPWPCVPLSVATSSLESRAWEFCAVFGFALFLLGAAQVTFAAGGFPHA